MSLEEMHGMIENLMEEAREDEAVIHALRRRCEILEEALISEWGYEAVKNLLMGRG